jgi:hypothetical protein
MCWGEVIVTDRRSRVCLRSDCLKKKYFRSRGFEKIFLKKKRSPVAFREANAVLYNDAWVGETKSGVNDGVVDGVTYVEIADSGFFRD